MVISKHAASYAACIIYCTPAALQSRQPLLLLSESECEHVHRAVHADWARDIPAEAYRDADGVKDSLITAASMAHLYCMRLKFGGRAGRVDARKGNG